MKLTALVSLVFLSMRTWAQTGAPDASSPKIELKLSGAVNAKRYLEIKISVVNDSNDTVVLSVSDRQPPFIISIQNQNGEDLYQYAGNYGKKDGKAADPRGWHRNVTWQFAPHETKEFNLTVDRLYPAEGKEAPIVEGKLSVQVRLGTVKYVSGRYQTTLYKSNVLDLNVGPRN
jgi:hypothetical protein